MWQIATDKKHGRAIVALDQFLTDHREAPDDAAQYLKTLDLTDGSRRGAMKGTKAEGTKTKGTKPRGSTATKPGTRTTTSTTTTAADGAAVVSEPPLEPPRPR